MKHRIIITFIVAAFLSGCAGMAQVYVDSINAPGAEVKKKYILLPGFKDIESTDLQFIEYTRLVDKALVSMGFHKTKDFTDANIAIFLAYGIGDPQKHQYAYSLPVWGQTGVSSSTTYGTVTTYGTHGTFHGTTTYTPTYGITGYTTHVETYTTYFRFLILDAIDLDEYKRSQRAVQAWKTTATSTGRTGDLRRVFPVLLAACKPYIATNTGKKVEIRLTENDKRVMEIKELKSEKGDTKPQITLPEKPPILKPATPPPVTNIVVVTGTFANIRSGAGDEFPIVTAVRKGDRLILLGESGDWFNVRLENGQQGWINSRFVKE